MTARPLGRAAFGHGVGHPDVAVIVDVDAMRPNEEATTETLDDLPVLIEFDHRVEIGIETFVAEPIGSGGVTSDDGPDMFAVRINGDLADGPHRATIGQGGPGLNLPIRVRQHLR